MKISASAPLFVLAFLSLPGLAQNKPAITLDEYMNATDITEARLSPDGSAAAIVTTDSDWQHDRYKENIWLWTRQSGTLTPLTHTGHDGSPVWSPDGSTIAFLSDRPLPGGDKSADDGETDAEEATRIWLIPAHGGEPTRFIPRTSTPTRLPGRRTAHA